MFKKISLFLFLSLTVVKTTNATLSFNELYPAPATGDYEWIELYNNEETDIDLSQYTAYDLAENKIILPPIILSGKQFIIATCSSILNNSGDTVYLKNNSGEIIETVTYPGGISADKSYSKCPDGTGPWFITKIITKNLSNNIACSTLTPTETPTVIISPTISPSLNPSTNPTIVSYSNIFISEAMVNPLTNENEWVELYNQNDFSVTLENWYIDDQEGTGSSPKIFFVEIGAKSYQTIELTNSIFNNDKDSVRLLDFDKNFKDGFEYNKTEKGKSWGRISFASDEFCLQEPTKNQPNNYCLSSNISSTSPTIKTILPSTTMITKIATPTIKPPVKTLINQAPFIIISPFNSNNNQNHGSVLGVYDNSNTNKHQLTIAVFSFLSITHSFLTLGYLFLKIKFHEAW